MSWWFYLTVAAYLSLWLITGQVNMLTGSVLTLLGISTATGLSAVAVDAQKSSDRVALTTRQTALQARIVQLGSPPTGSDLEKELQVKQSELTQVTARIQAQPVPMSP